MADSFTEDVGLPSNRLVYDVDDITRRGPEGKIKRDAAKKRVLKKYNLEGARSDWKVSSSKLGTILANLPTNVRLLTEFMLGKDKPISVNDFTKDELASIIALSEEQQENYKNVQNRKLKNQPENVTTVDGYDTTQPYRFSKWIENSPYFRTLAFTLTDPNYQIRTTLGRYDTEETPSSIIIKDAYNMNIKQRDLPNPFGGREELSKVLEEVRSNPEVAGEFLANIIKPNPKDSRKFNLVIPKRKPDQPSPRDTAYQAPMQLKEKSKNNPRIKEKVPEGFDILKFDKGGDVANYRTRLVDMTDEGRAEVAPGSSAYGNFLGNTGDKKPLSVQMAETGLDLATPVGTIKDIQDELGKEDPSYALIAGMASLELLGPAAGAIKMAAKSGNKGVIQKILDSFKNKPAPGFEESALKTAANQNDLSREILVEMPIDDFLAAAKKEVSPEKLEKTRRLISEGTPFETIPSLQFKNNGDGTAKVIGHDGRHRAMALKEKGETTIPVRLESSGGDGPSIRWGQQSDPNSSDYVDTLPKQLVEEDGEALINMPDTGIRRKEDLGFNEDVYHYTVSKTVEGDKFNPDRATGPWNKLGVHVGGQKASNDRFTGINDPERYPENVKGSTLPLKARTDKPLMFSDEVESEYSVQSNLRKMAEARGLDPTDYAADLRKQLAEEGYTHIPYINEVEAEGTISYIMLVDRPEGSDAVLRSKFAEFDPSKKDKPELGLAEGGEVNNMSMKKQMSLFEYGGIADDGMNKDPVSGNNVPPGSLAKEVRDDIPAMLSEGEYVVPADVLRYYGVNFFENLRGQAKQGLNTMEQNGRIGGTPMTEQDVARNMQQVPPPPQPMAPPPVQAAQGAMMQSPLRIKQQPAPQAVGNSGVPTQGYAGEDGSIVSKWSPARARYSSPMFQGTSSQQDNIAAAQELAATEEVTQLRNHYNQAGESVQVRYSGTSLDNMSVAEGQEDLLSQYPLTEEEYLAYKKEMSKNGDSGGSGDGGGGGGTTVSGGSDTSWMDGIDFTDTASVKKWVESDDGLGMSGGARQLAGMGAIGLIPQGIQANDIAKTRGIRSYFDSIGDTEMVEYLDGQLKDAMEKTGILTSALDKLGLMSGDSYVAQITKQVTDTSGDMVKDASGASVYKPGGIDVAMLDTSDDGPGLTAAEQSAVDRSRARAAASRAAVQAAFDAGAGTKAGSFADPSSTAEEIQDFKEKVEEAGGTWNVGGRAEGGLMTTPKLKKKKKSKPKKTGLAGKK